MRLINADALKENLKLPEESGRMGELLGMVIDAVIEDAPTIEPEPQWIPCSERFPENDERVLVCGERGGIAIARYSENNDFFGDCYHIFWTNGNKIIKAIAWMPLPAPWKGKQT